MRVRQAGVAALIAIAITVGPLCVGVMPASATGRALHNGSTGPAVRTLEERLHTLGLLPSRAVDGRFRPATRRAVTRFQRQVRLRPTGRVNARTWKALAIAAARRSRPPTATDPAWAPPAILAHRGGVGPALPENTLASMRYAARYADVLEFDVRQTADGVLVLMHDATLDRTTNCSGQVSAWTAADLRELCTVQGEPVPTVDEVAAFAKAASMPVAPEVKGASVGSDALAALVDVIRAHGLVERTYVQSFHPDYFASLRSMEPRLRLVYLTTSVTTLDEVRRADVEIAGLNLRGLSAATVTAYHAADLRVWTYSALTAADLRIAWRLRVDGVITDVSHQARAIYHPRA